MGEAFLGGGESAFELAHERDLMGVVGGRLFQPRRVGLRLRVQVFGLALRGFARVAFMRNLFVGALF